MAQTGNRRLLLTSLCEEGPTEVGLVRPRVVKRKEMRGRLSCRLTIGNDEGGK